MESIILCGMPASGKTTVAKIIASKLGFAVIGGGDILKEMARDRGYKITGDDWWDTPDGIKFLRERDGNPDFDKEADRRIVQKIKEGNFVVTSYTAPWLSKEGFKVWLGATQDNRAGRMSLRDSSAMDESKAATKIRDDENTSLYRKLYKIDFGADMSPFDLIVDTNEIFAEQVAAKIIEAYRLRNNVK
ncbi:MAG: AAA family ATPase [Candidatus Micrarchaeota archaeon]|nr:AAA family ATPase [Candidatus Micrarchaeota archaeon]